MARAADTSAIYRLIGRARRRIRSQWALEGATTALILAAAAALVSVFAVRMELVKPATGIALLIGAGAIVVLGAVISAARRLDDETVARRIDRASKLSDRLSTAIAFNSAAHAGDDTTYELMLAAIRDGVRAAPRADIRKATPFTVPKDLRAAIGFLAVSALAAGLAIPSRDREPHLYRATPDHAARGDTVVIEGDNLLVGVTPPIAMASNVRWVIGAPGADAVADDHRPRFVPSDASVYMGRGQAGRPVPVLDWTGTSIQIRVPNDAPLGDTVLIAWIENKPIGPVKFTVIRKDDPRYHNPDNVEFPEDEEQYIKSIVAELRQIAQRDKVPELNDFATKIEQLLEKAKNGEITKEQLLDELQKAEDALNGHPEPKPEEINKQLSDMGKELSKNPETKPLGDALQKNDLEKAQQELEKLADKLDNKELTEQQKEELAKKLEQVAKQMDKKEQEHKDKQDQAEKKIEDQIRRLEKEKKEAKNERQRQDTERRLEEKKRELQKLKKEDEQREQSDQRRAVKRLQKDLEKSAENMQKQKNQQERDQEQDQNERDRQSSQKLRDAARETGRVDRDQRKQASQRKMSSQMDDLREAMRRAKQKGNKGQNDPFNKGRKNQDFIARARGQKSGQGQSWRPGQGQKGDGQGQGDKNGEHGPGDQPGGEKWGVGHDPNLTGDPTAMNNNTKDEGVQGKQGRDGNSTREVILAAAQKGFASERYKNVYAKYAQVVEEVMRAEKLPSSYKYYVKRYFAKIHPSTEAPTEAPKQ